MGVRKALADLEGMNAVTIRVIGRSHTVPQKITVKTVSNRNPLNPTLNPFTTRF